MPLTNYALDTILDTFFLRSGSPPTALFMGLVDFTNFTAFDPSDLMATHPGWQELTTYSQATRPQWLPSLSAGQQLSNPVPTVFTMNSPSSVYGVFLSTDNVKGGTAGILIGPGALDLVQVLQSGDPLKVQLLLPAVSGQG